MLFGYQENQNSYFYHIVFLTPSCKTKLPHKIFISFHFLPFSDHLITGTRQENSPMLYNNRFGTIGNLLRFFHVLGLLDFLLRPLQRCRSRSHWVVGFRTEPASRAPSHPYRCCTSVYRSLPLSAFLGRHRPPSGALLVANDCDQRIGHCSAYRRDRLVPNSYWSVTVFPLFYVYRDWWISTDGQD